MESDLKTRSKGPKRGLKPALQPGDNPRKKLRQHRERGHSKFTYTIRTVAKLVELSVSAVRTHIKGGKFDLKDLGSVVEYVGARRLDSKLILEGADMIDNWTEDHKTLMRPEDVKEARAISTYLRSLVPAPKSGPRGPAGGTGRNKGKRYRIHFEIIGARTGEVIGCTEDRKSVLEEEPGSGFRRVARSKCSSCLGL